MVENAIGRMPIPLGIAEGFSVDDHRVNVPMATEEPSVIAAATFAGSLIARHGGHHTEAGEPEMTAQIYVEGAHPNAATIIAENEEALKQEIAETLVPMTRRGGGYRATALVVSATTSRFSDIATPWGVGRWAYQLRVQGAS
jgi:hydroxymethylglutaryl-CoA reductase